MKKLLTILAAVMTTTVGLKAQFSFTAENATTTVQFVPCGQPDTLQINITAAGAQTSAQVGVKLPSNGVFASLVSGGTLLSSSTDSFTVDLGNMTSGQTITLRYRVRMNCVGASNPAFNAAYRATSTTHTSTFTGQSYASSVYAPVLQFLAVDIDTSGLQEGGIHTRKYTIANSSASAISYFDTVYFRGKYKTGEAFVDLKVGSTTVTPTQSGDSLLYAITGAMLDADGRLNGGQSVSVEERVQVINQCALNNATTDPVQAYYGCFATRGCTAPVQLNAVTQVGATLNQGVVATVTNRIAQCQGAAPDTMYFTVSNPATAGKARDITFNIESNFADYNYDSRQTLSFFLNGSLNATYNGVAYNLLKDTLQVLQKHEQLHAALRTGAPIWYAAVPNDAIYNIRFRLDSMNPGDTIRGYMLYTLLCDSAAMVDHVNYYWSVNSPGYGSWSLPGLKNLRSRNNCNGNLVFSHPGTQSNRAPVVGGAAGAYMSMNTIGSIVGTENYYPSVSGNARVVMGAFDIAELRMTTARSIVEARVILPLGLTPASLTPSNYRVRALLNNAVSYTAYMVSVVGNELRIRFKPTSNGSFGLGDRYLDIPLNLDCGVLSGPKTDSIQAKWFVRVDSTCTSGCGFLNFARTSNLPVALHCPGTLPNGGLQAVSYDHRRWNLGLADYDNNGIPDGTGKAHPDSVVLNEFTFGDTMYTIQKGRVVVTGSTPGGAFTHGYSVQRFILPAASQLASSQANFQPQGAKLVIYSNATAATYTVNGFMPSRHRFGDTVYYIYHLSNDSLRGKGNVPGSFAWANGDSITLESYTRFRTNGSSNEDVYVINQENDIYMATNAITTTNTAAINSHLRYTDEIKAFETDIYRLFNFAGVYGSVSFTTVNTCIANSSYDQGSSGYVTLRQQNRAIYPKEYRRFQRLLAAQVTIPRKGVVIDSIRLFVSNSAVAGGGLTVLRVPDSALTMRYDSGFARIDLAKMMVAMGRPQGFDEGYTLTYRMHFRRNGAVMEQDPNSFSASAANLKIGVEYDAEGTDWGDLVNPFSGQVGRHNWYTAGQGASITRFLNPNYDGSALGAVTKTISGKTTSFDVRLQNATGAQQMDVDSAWVYFFSPSGAIKLKGATNITTSTALPVANGKLVRLGSLPAGQTRDVRLDVEFADGCGTDSFRVFYSWNCPGVSSPVADSQLVNFAVQDTTTHTITKFDPILENTTTVSRTANIALCDTILVSTLINNAGGGIGYDVDFSFTAPNFGTGIEFVPGSFRLQYPASGGPVVSIPAPTAIGGGQYRWVDITQYIAALDTQGLAAFTDPVNNKMRVSFQTRFTCGFNSGLTLNTNSQASCGTAGTSSFTTPIRLKAENQAANQFYTCTTDADTVNTCGLASANTLRTVFTNLNASANPSGANDSIFVYLPAGVSFNSGVASSPRAPDRAVAQPDGRQRLSWRVNGVAKGASQTFTYGVTGNDTLSCNVIQIQNQSGAFVQDTCILDGSLCLTGVIKSDVNSNLTIQKPAINLTAATATSVYNTTTPVNEIVTINYSVNNTGTASTSHQIRTYHDADASGTFTPGDVLVNTRTINTNIANGGTHSGSFNLDLVSSQTCPLILVIEQSACQCSRSQGAISNIKLNNAGIDTGLCHGTSVVLGTGIGPSAYTYAWSPATDLTSTTVSNPTINANNTTGANIVNTYILTTTRNSVASCTNLDTVVVTERPLPTIAVLRDTSICLGQSVTYTQIGGGTYSWNTLPVQTTAAITVSPTANTEYRVTVTGANGCQRSDTAVVSLRATPTANAGGAKSRVNCAGDSVQVGSAAVAGHTYTWSPATGLSATNVAMPWAKPTVTTTYRMTITNTTTGCTAIDSAVVTVNASSLVANAGNDATVCQGAPTITIGASPTASGGNTPYTYAWSPATGLSSTSTANPTAATTTAAVTNYALMLTDGKGCIARDTVRVTINARPSVAPSATPATVCNGVSSTIAANATGGTTPYTYTWTPAGSGASHTQSPVSTTNYGVTVTDANTCTASGTVTLNVTGTSPLTANAGAARTICSGASTNLGGSPTASGGSGGFTYAWSSTPAGFSNSTANPTASPTATTTYTVTVTSSGCTATNTVVVTVNTSPSLAPSATPATVCSGVSSTIAANATGGTAPLTYVWNAGSGASHSAAPATTTTYNVTVTDANTCTASGTVTLNVNALPTANAGPDQTRVNCVGDSAQIGTASVAGHTYSWSPATGLSAANVAMPWAKPAATTTYVMTITHTATGCTRTDDVIVTVNTSSLAANAGSAITVCQDAPTVTLGGSPTATGGTSPYTYSWSGAGLSSTTASNPTKATATASTVTHTVTVSDAKGCTANSSQVVTIRPRPTVAPSASVTTICNGASTTVSANATGGTAPLVYTWSPSGTGASFSASPSSNTTYMLTVSDANSCSATGSVVVNVTGSSPLTANAGNARTICSGASTNLGGSPTAGGGSGGFTYSWTSSPAGFTSTSANPTVSPTVTTTYTLTVTSSGCTATNTVVVTVNPTPTIAPSASATTICNGQSVTINANAAGGTAPLGYTWNIGSGASHSHSPTTNTTYQVTTTDANGCSANGSVTVNVTGSTPLAADAGAARAICNGVSTSLGGVPTATGGAGGYTYAWSGGAGTTANPTVSPTATTTYTVTVTSSGCTVSSSVVVTVNPRPSVAPSATPSTICNGQSTTVAANATGGTAPLTYTWTGGGSGASFTASPSATTSYPVTVSDANSCTATGSVTVNVTGISPLVANAGAARTICSGASTSLGAVPTATGGSGGYTYAWSGGASAVANPTVSPTTTTTYTVTVTSSGCTATSSVVVTVNPSPSAAPSASATTICNGQSVTINANATGGTAPLTYTWNIGSGASHTHSPTTNTTYLVTVSDANSCTATGSVSVIVTGSTPLAASAGSARAICNGSSTTLGGTPTATGGAGGYTYAWSNSAGTTANPTVSPTATTTYTVTVTSSGCTATSSVVVTVNPRPSVAPNATPAAICNGESSTIAANATGGTAPLTYTWSSGGSSASFTATPGTTTAYGVTVSDANSCTASGSVTVNVTGTSPLVAVAGSARAICNGGSTTLGGSPTASGGAGSYTYAWSGGAGTAANPTVSPTTTTTYTVTVTSSGCTASSSVVVTVNPRPNVAPSASIANVCFGGSSTVSANASGGTGTISYTWSPSGSGSSFVATPNATTIYNVTATDLNGCTATGSVSVNVIGSSPLTANAGTNRTICNGSSTNLGSAPTGNGGNTSGTYTYAWSSNPAGFSSTAANPTVSPTATTTYTVTVTNSTCTATNTVVVSVNPRPAAAPSASVNPVCSGSNTTLTANASGGTSPYTYQWNTSQTSASFVASPTTTAPIVNAYTVTVTDVNSCSISATVNVNVTPLPVVASIANQSMCIPASGGSVALSAAALTAGQTGAWTTVTSPTGAVTFSAASAANTNVSTLTPINTYTFRWTLTESGCSNSTTTNVTVNESPVIEAGMNDTICLNTSKTLSASLTSISPAAINWKANAITATPFAFTTSTTVSPTVTTRYIFTAAISPCIVSDTVVVGVIGVPDLVNDLATCLSATEDVATTFDIPATIGTNDALGLVIRGGVTYKVLSSKNSTATVSGTTLNYASNLNFYGKDTVVIEAYSNECTPLRDTAMFCVDVAGVNDKPTVNPDTVKAIGTNPKTFNPLANDSDIETTLKGGNISVVSGPNSGTLTGPAADGTFTYTGNSSNLAILDTIVIQVCDSGLPMPAQCDVSSIIVQLVPDVKDTAAEVKPGTPVTIGTPITTGPGVSMTPSLTGSNGTSGTTITTPSGTATIDPTTGVMTFTPNDTPFIGSDTIRRVLCFTYPDGSEACDTSIFVVSNPSVTNTSGDSTAMNTPKVVGTLKPYKFEGGVATTTTTPNATIDPVTGAVTYTPKPGFVGVDTVKVTRCDSKGNCVTDVFVVTVTPSLPDTSVTASGNTPVNLGPAIVGGNGTTVETTLVGPKHGTATKNADGTVTYTPSGSYVGRDTITRIVKVTYPDGTVKYDTQMVVVKNTLPDVVNPDGDIIVKQDEKKDIGTLPVVTFEGSPVTTTITSSAGGSATVDSTGKVTYTPKPGFFGTDTIKIVRCDNLGNCVTSIFVIKVEEVVSDIPNYFSPNGDGVNDVWNLDGLLNRYPNAKAIIYNRWGNVVWRSTGPYGKTTSGANLWYGQQEGGQENVPDGVYYYLIELEDEFKKTKTGFIEVMRQ